jgi:hypothetical protein
MDTIIAYRVNDGSVEFVIGEGGNVAIFPSWDHADSYANANRLFHSGQPTLNDLPLGMGSA